MRRQLLVPPVRDLHDLMYFLFLFSLHCSKFLRLFAIALKFTFGGLFADFLYVSQSAMTSNLSHEEPSNRKQNRTTCKIM